MNWLDQIRRRKDDRGLMATLRCSLVETRRHRAWPALSRLGISVTDGVGAITAGLYATHPEEIATGNFGTTCKSIQASRDKHASDNTETKVTPTERRFEHLLAAEPGNEILGRVTRMVLMAKAAGIPINYAQLEKDLRNWDKHAREAWASAFWTYEPVTGTITETEERS